MSNFKAVFVFCALMCMGTLASASSVLVDSVAADWTRTDSMFSNPVSVSGYQFEINASLGRARLDIDYTDGQSDPDSYGPPSDQVLVSGLTYDVASSSVIYTDSNGAVSVCATGTSKVSKTGNCFLTSEVVQQEHDDGFNIYYTSVLNVYLNTK